METRKLFELVKAINREGLDCTEWSADDHYGTNSRDFYGTEEIVMLLGYYIVLWSREMKDLEYLNVGKPTHSLKLKAGGYVHLWEIS